MYNKILMIKKFKNILHNIIKYKKISIHRLVEDAKTKKKPYFLSFIIII